ncbi:hypothetical protein [Sutcliffiella deserti]|uniref:hypothetical protein n=1 Tax=Sutcliffiella deserti TaxID=2875501 RepID=UPI001CBCE04C|nr:hypothetical protein [Sutcliffiella deserti]
MEKRLYYVTLDTGEIHREPFDDQVNYYEIMATEKEIMEIEHMFGNLHDSEYSPEPLMKPWSESRGQERRNLQQSLVDRIFTSIYELGTDQTKEDIKTMNGLNQRL